MDVLVLIDKLDDLVHNAKTVPMTGTVRVDQEEIYDILDQMRATIPEEIKQARWIVKERQEMLARGQARGRAHRQGGARAPDAADLRSRRSPSRPSARRRTSSRTPAPASARSASARRTTPTRSSTRSRSTSRSSSPPSSAAASGCRARTSRPKSASTAQAPLLAMIDARRMRAALALLLLAVALAGCGGGPRAAVAAKPDVDGCAGSWLRPVAANERAGARGDALPDQRPARAARARAADREPAAAARGRAALARHGQAQVLRAPATPTGCSRTRGSCARATRRSSWARTSRGARLAKSTPAEIVALWMKSPGHRANILEPGYREIGIGFAYEAPEPQDEPRQAAIYTTTFGAGGR